MNPQNVRNAEFKTARKGFDREEVSQFLAEVADSLEKAQNHATAMEARARAAVQRAQELTSAQPAVVEADPVAAAPEEAETISRALLLAQRTADSAVAEAEVEAETLRTSAAEEATRELDAARELASQMTETARVEAEKTFAGQREAIAGEIAELVGDRDLLAADVDALEGFLAAQRERIRDAASTLADLTERIPGGLAAMAAPVLESTTIDDTAEFPAPGAVETDAGREPVGDVESSDQAGDPPDTSAPPESVQPVEPVAGADDATQALDVSDLTADVAADPPVETTDDLLIVTDLDEQSDDRPPDSDPTPVDRSESLEDLRLNLADES